MQPTKDTHSVGLLPYLPAIVGLGGCLSMATVPPGYGGVLVTSRGVAPAPIREGTTLLGPFSHVDLFDLRAQQHTEDLVALSADGAPVEAHASLVAFHLVASELPALEREVGPGYYDTIVAPIVRSTVFRILGRYRAYELDTPTIRRAQTAITTEAAVRLRPFHVVVDSVDIRTLAVLYSARSYDLVLATSAEEQIALGAPQRAEIARRQAEALRATARGLAASHDAIAPTLSPIVLRDAAARAWARLLSSPSARVVVANAARALALEITP